MSSWDNSDVVNGEDQGQDKAAQERGPLRAGKVDIDPNKLSVTQLMGTVKLPRGVRDANGSLQRSVTLRQMSGKNVASLVTGGKFDKDRLLNVLCDCCESFGDYTKANDAKTIRKFLTEDVLLAEQQYLLLQLRQLALGPVFDYRALCHSCEHVGEYSANLPDLLLTGDFEAEPDQVMSYEDIGGRKWSIEWHLMTAGDDKWFTLLYERWQANYNKLKAKEREAEFAPGDLSILMALFISRVHAVVDPSGVRHITRRRPSVQSSEADVVESDPLTFMVELPQEIFEEFALHVNDVEPALDNKIEFSCENCGVDMETPIMMGHSAFFAGSSRRAKRL